MAGRKAGQKLQYGERLCTEPTATQTGSADRDSTNSGCRCKRANCFNKKLEMADVHNIATRS